MMSAFAEEDFNSQHGTVARKVAPYHSARRRDLAALVALANRLKPNNGPSPTDEGQSFER